MILGSYKDWRLPNINELNSIVVRGKIPSIKNGFQNTKEKSYWSSSTDMGSKNYAERIDFEHGGIGNTPKDEAYVFVRCVRGGE